MKPNLIIFIRASTQKIEVTTKSMRFSLFIVSLYESIRGCSNARVIVDSRIKRMMKDSKTQWLVTTSQNLRIVFSELKM